MKSIFKKLSGWFHRHPGIKTTAVGVLGAAATAAGAGVFGPKGVLIGGAVGSVAGLWTKKPSDATDEDKAGIVVGDVVVAKAAPDVKMTVYGVGPEFVYVNWSEGDLLRAGQFKAEDLSEVAR